MQNSNVSFEAGGTPAPSSSLMSRLMNVFAAPGEVFEEVKSSPPSTANWFVPVLLSCVVGVTYVMVVFSQPAIQQQLRDQQEKKLSQRVEKGKMTAEQADQARKGIEAMGSKMDIIVKVSGSAGAVATSFVWVFVIGLVLMLLGKLAFKSPVAYMKAVETAGLAGMITVLGGIIGMLLAVGMGSMMATPSPALFIGDFDPSNKVHLSLASLNVITLWYVAVLSVGLSRLSGASFAKSAAWLYGLWLLLRVGAVLLGSAF